MIESEDWRGRAVLVTGHTGFKGAWLCLWLAEMGAEVHGLALDPTPDSLYAHAGIASRLASDTRGDIVDAAVVDDCVTAVEPEIVFHLAAQPIVRTSYRLPRATFAVNVMGTVHVLTAAAGAPAARAVVSVTTDKVYLNDGRLDGYREGDPLGGRDPYSASKACADLASLSIAHSFSRPDLGIATARSGNVIGGGDTGKDRLLPDLLRAFERGSPAKIRNPGAIRPWQHVLDPVAGYIRLAEHLHEGGAGGPWNFGPVEPALTVAELADLAAESWTGQAEWSFDADEHPHEELFLTLDPTRAITELGWVPRLSIRDSVKWTVEFAERVRAEHNAADIMVDQICRYGAPPSPSR